VSAALLPIGSFARRCRLSVKALRHYDELGLLRPARIDVATGYRYYDRPQAPAAYKERLRGIAGLSHVTVEVEPCQPKKRRSAA